MNNQEVLYVDGFKFQLVRDVSCYVSIRPEQDIITDFIELYTTGLLVLKKGFAWDGCSGPTIDTDANFFG